MVSCFCFRGNAEIHRLSGGELICFFGAPTRLVSSKGAKTTESTPQKQSSVHRSVTGADYLAQPTQSTETLLFSPSAFLSEAVRLLTLSAVDRSDVPDPRKQKGEDMGQAMTDLLTLFRYQGRRNIARGGAGVQRGPTSAGDQIALVQVRRSMLYASNTSWLDGPDKNVAAGYVFEADTLTEMCLKNAIVARNCERYDHERVWKTLEVLFKSTNALGRWLAVDCENMAKQVFMKM